MKIPASKVPAQVWADKARRRADLDEVESMLLSSWDDSKQVYRIGKELWDELRIDEADEVPVDALLRLPYGCIFIERRWVDEYEQLLTDDMADTWGEASCYVTRYYEGKQARTSAPTGVNYIRENPAGQKKRAGCGCGSMQSSFR